MLSAPTSGVATVRERSSQSVALYKDGVEVRRWELPGAKRQLERPPALLKGKMREATSDLLLAPGARAIRDNAFAAALREGHERWIAEIAGNVAMEAVIDGRSPAEALLMGAIAAELLTRGFPEELARLGASKGGDMLLAGFSPGSSFAGGIAYAYALRDGCSDHCAHTAALSAANTAEDAADEDAEIYEGLSRGDIAADILKKCLDAGEAAGVVCTEGPEGLVRLAARKAAEASAGGSGDGRADEVGRKAADALRGRGFPGDLVKAGSDKAKELLAAGYSPGAAIGGGIAYAEGLRDGLSKHCAEVAAVATAKAAESAGKSDFHVAAALERGDIPEKVLQYALSTGRAAGRDCMKGKDGPEDDVARRAADLLRGRGLSEDLVKDGADKAKELFLQGFSPGAAMTGGIAYAEGLRDGLSKHCADVAAKAAAKAAEEMAMADQYVKSALDRGNVPPMVLDHALGKAWAVGQVCMDKDAFGLGGKDGKVAKALLGRGFSPELAQKGAEKALTLLKEGFSPGAAMAGGIAYAEGLRDGLSEHCADVAAHAAAASAEAAGKRDSTVKAALERAETPPAVLEEALASGRAAGQECMQGKGGDLALRKTADALRDRGLGEDLVKAGADKAKELFLQGFSPGAAMAGGIAYAEGLRDGLSKHCADKAAKAAATVADEARKSDPKIKAALGRGECPPEVLMEALAVGRAAGQNCMNELGHLTGDGSRYGGTGTEPTGFEFAQRRTGGGAPIYHGSHRPGAGAGGGGKAAGHQDMAGSGRGRNGSTPSKRAQDGRGIGRASGPGVTGKTADLLRSRGFPEDLAKAGGIKADELLRAGHSPGAAMIGGVAYAEGLRDGLTKHCADKAARAAAKAADDMSEADSAVKSALANGETPPEVMEKAHEAGRAAGFACMEAKRLEDEEDEQIRREAEEKVRKEDEERRRKEAEAALKNARRRRSSLHIGLPSFGDGDDSEDSGKWGWHFGWPNFGGSREKARRNRLAKDAGDLRDAIDEAKSSGLDTDEAERELAEKEEEDRRKRAEAEKSLREAEAAARAAQEAARLAEEAERRRREDEERLARKRKEAEDAARRALAERSKRETQDKLRAKLGGGGGREAVAGAASDLLKDRGFGDDLATAGAQKAKELLDAGFSPGAAVIGGVAYAEALDAGLSKHCANVAATAAANAAEEAGEESDFVAAQLARGESPPSVFEKALAAGRAAGKACMQGAGRDADDSLGVADHLLDKGYPADLARKAAKQAADLLAMGFAPGAAFAGGVAYAEGIKAGFSEHCAQESALAAAKAAQAAGKRDPSLKAKLKSGDLPKHALEEALTAGRAAGQKCMQRTGGPVADMLRKLGFSGVLAKEGAAKAADLRDEGFSPGASMIGGVMYAEGLRDGLSKHCANVASHAAAMAADDAADADPYVKASLGRGEMPPEVMEKAMHKGREAGRACTEGKDYAGLGGDNGKVAKSLLDRGFTLDTARKAAKVAVDLLNMGFSPGAAMAGGIAYAEGLNEGFSENCARKAAMASAKAAKEEGKKDAHVLAALERGETPPEVMVTALAAGLAAGRRCMARGSFGEDEDDLDLDALRAAIEEAKRAGLDTSAAEKRLREAEEKARREAEARRRHAEQERLRRQKEDEAQRHRAEDDRRRREAADKARREAVAAEQRAAEERVKREAYERAMREREEKLRQLSGRGAGDGGAAAQLAGKSVNDFLRSRGFPDDLIRQGMDKASDLVKAGFSPGASAIGGIAYAEGLQDGLSRHCANVAALAAAKMADDMGDDDPYIGSALARGEMPDEVFDAVLEASRNAGSACMEGKDPFNFGGDGGSVVAEAKRRGLSPDLARAAGQKAIDLLNAGYKPGAAFAGGLAYAEGLRDGLSKHCAETAAITAANTAEAIGKLNKGVKAQLKKGFCPPEVLEKSLEKGRAAGKRCMNEQFDAGLGGDNGKVAAHLLDRGFPLDLARQGADKAVDLLNEGFSPGAAMAGGIAYAQGLKDGLSEHCANEAAHVAAKAAENAGKKDKDVRTMLKEGDLPPDVLEDALAAARLAGQACMDRGDGDSKSPVDLDALRAGIEEARRLGLDTSDAERALQNELDRLKREKEAEKRRAADEAKRRAAEEKQRKEEDERRRKENEKRLKEDAKRAAEQEKRRKVAEEKTRRERERAQKEADERERREKEAKAKRDAQQRLKMSMGGFGLPGFGLPDMGDSGLNRPEMGGFGMPGSPGFGMPGSPKFGFDLPGVDITFGSGRQGSRRPRGHAGEGLIDLDALREAIRQAKLAGLDTSEAERRLRDEEARRAAENAERAQKEREQREREEDERRKKERLDKLKREAEEKARIAAEEAARRAAADKAKRDAAARAARDKARHADESAGRGYGRGDPTRARNLAADAEASLAAQRQAARDLLAQRRAVAATMGQGYDPMAAAAARAIAAGMDGNAAAEAARRARQGGSGAGAGVGALPYGSGSGSGRRNADGRANNGLGLGPHRNPHGLSPAKVGGLAADQLRRRGYSDGLIKAGSDNAKELLAKGYSPGAAVMGGIAMAEALDAGISKACADVAALAAADTAEAAAARDPAVNDALEHGEVPQEVSESALAAGRAAARECMRKHALGLGPDGNAGGDGGLGGDNGSVAKALRNRGLGDELARAGAMKAVDLLAKGFTPGAAFAGGIAYAEGLRDGLSKHCADVAAEAAARSADAAGKRNPSIKAALSTNDVPPRLLEEALAAGRAAGEKCMSSGGRLGGLTDLDGLSLEELRALGYEVKLLGENDVQLRKWNLATAGQTDESQVIAQLDAAMQPSKLGSLYDAQINMTLDTEVLDHSLPVSATELAREAVIKEHVIQERLNDRGVKPDGEGEACVVM